LDRERPTGNTPKTTTSHNEPASLIKATSDSIPLRGETPAGDSKLFDDLEEMLSVLIHNGKNYLGPIKGYASLIQDDNDDRSNTRRWADKIMRNVRQMEDHFEQLNSYRIRGTVGVSETSWQRLVSGVMDRFAAVNVKGVPIEITNDTRGKFRQHIGLLKRVLSHIVVNAYESIGSTGKLSLFIVDAQPTEDGRRSFAVRITDTGRGIEAKDIGAIWKPFYTTKHNHVGLGLSYVAAAAEILDMELNVASKTGHGTTVTLILAEQGG
jgi:signal transduction histidine kinase